LRGPSQWTTTGANIFFSSGNVGIGSNTPATKLDVPGTIRSGNADTNIGSHPIFVSAYAAFWRPQGRDHLNGTEGFRSYAKHSLFMYRGVPQKFFHLYLGEISFRFNHRHED
jgi:hypothetical protein